MDYCAQQSRVYTALTDYRLTHCGAFLAFLRPGFLRSTILESLSIKPSEIDERNKGIGAGWLGIRS